MRTILLIAIVTSVLSGCDYFKSEPEKIPVARVNDSYLYQEDIRSLITEQTTEEDSALIVNNYITRWATQQLLIEKAKINISEDNLERYEKLVADYKNDLYTEAYKNSVVSQQLDSTVTNRELQEYYELHRENFRLNDRLVKIRYIHVSENFSNLVATREKLGRFNQEDSLELSKLSIQFNKFNFDDDTWVKTEALKKALPVLNENEDKVLKKSNFAQLQDSLGVYLVKIEDVLYPNDIAPLSFIKPTIEQIIINRRKLELIKELEKDITKDAIKNKDFEIYTIN